MGGRRWGEGDWSDVTVLVLLLGGGLILSGLVKVFSGLIAGTM